MDIIAGNWKKKESKTLKTFQNVLQQISQSPSGQSEQAELSSRGNVFEEIGQKLHISGNTGRIPYLNNPFEETIFGSNKIRGQHETVKLQNEEVMLGSTENLD